MAATAPASPRACEVPVYVVGALIKLRDLLASKQKLARPFRALERLPERKLDTHDRAIAGICDAIRQLMAGSAETKKRPIGFGGYA